MLVATADAAVVGVAASAESDAAQPRPLELRALYLLAAHHGSGLGQALLDAAVGDLPAYLWVARENPRARAFYTRNGFRPDGATGEHRGMVTVRMVR